MSDGPLPEPSESVPQYLGDGLQKQSPETLEEIADYATRLAMAKREHLKAKIEQRESDVDDIPDEWADDEWTTALKETDAPSKATLTTKEIDGREYFYYQWREGSKIKSEYVAPVSPTD